MNEQNIRKREHPVEPKDTNSSPSERLGERRRKINCVILFLFVYFPAGGMIIGMMIGMRRGPFPKPNLIGRKNFALLTRRERTSSVSVSVCLSVCLKSKCSMCVSEFRVTVVVWAVERLTKVAYHTSKPPWSPCK